MDSDQLTDVSRVISETLDESPDAPAGQYVLEVSTPGATRKLTEPRHFRRAEGRKVILTTADGEVTGRLESVEGDTLAISNNGHTQEIAISDVVNARVDVEL